ncbi:MAG: glycosyltransferase family 4 protein [Spirochaetales bacterium]|nr:glycosyltransferase family 4 protein [Spirochaetales bacterium]
MKVLMFGWEFPPFISGGLGVACYGIVKGLNNNNVEIKLVLPTTGGQKTDLPVEICPADKIVISETYKKKLAQTMSSTTGKEMLSGIISPYETSVSGGDFFNRYQNMINELNIQGKDTILAFTGNYGRDLMAEVFRYSIIGEFLGSLGDFDIIHAHDWLTILAGVGAKRLSGKPLVIQIHATEVDRSGSSINSNIFNIEKYGMEQADRIIAVSYYTKNIIVNKYGIDPHKVTVVHNAVEKKTQLERLGIQKNLDEKYVLFLGRVTMQKGPDYFIEAANLVLKKIKNIRFVMAGSGDMMPRLIERAAALKITDRFHFTGFLNNRQQVERMYAMSDLYVMPSVSEPFGITAFEALLYDVPIILSKQSGVAEVLRGAMKVDFWDVPKLASAIVTLLEDEKLSKEMVESCKHELQDIHWNTASQKIKNLYHSLLFHNSH